MYVLKSYLASYNYSGHYKVLIKYVLLGPAYQAGQPVRQIDSFPSKLTIQDVRTESWVNCLFKLDQISYRNKLLREQIRTVSYFMNWQRASSGQYLIRIIPTITSCNIIHHRHDGRTDCRLDLSGPKAASLSRYQPASLLVAPLLPMKCLLRFKLHSCTVIFQRRVALWISSNLFEVLSNVQSEEG